MFESVDGHTDKQTPARPVYYKLTYSFIKISPLVPGKKILKVFLPYMSMAANLFMWMNFIFSVLTSLHSKLAENGPAATEKTKFNFHT